MREFFSITVLLSAALLFAVQPLIARMLLPRFGGAAAVWMTCLVFFQVALLAGYGYVHWLSRRVAVRRQAACQAALLGVALVLAPLVLLPSVASGWTSVVHPTVALLGLLVASIGLPFVVLSTTA